MKLIEGVAVLVHQVNNTCNEKNPPVENLNKKQKIKQKSTQPSTKPEPVKESAEPLNVSVRLATFTLVNVLKNQGLFYQALEVLDLLEEKGEDPDMIRLEREAVKTLIESVQKDSE